MQLSPSQKARGLEGGTPNKREAGRKICLVTEWTRKLVSDHLNLK